MRISTDYKELLEQYRRETDKSWGASGWKFFLDVEYAWKRLGGGKRGIDYGCGEATLTKKAMNGTSLSHVKWQLYDPCIPKYSTEPVPADIVVCTDVMEHVEEECVPAVLAHIRYLGRKGAFFHIVTKLAGQVLPDGRNAHITVKRHEWWQEQLEQHWPRVEFFSSRYKRTTKGHLYVCCHTEVE